MSGKIVGGHGGPSVTFRMPEKKAPSGWTILLVDDEEDIRESLRDYLEMKIEGLEVHTAESGPAALKLLKTKRVDLIISDYKMPEMDGLQFLQKVPQVHPPVPRIILTAFPKLELAMQAINEVEIDRFLTKPIRPEDLEKVVMTFLQQKTQPSPKAGASFASALDPH